MPKKDFEQDKLFVKISSPFEIFYEGSAYAVSAVNNEGPFDILPHHANFLSILLPGSIEVNTGKKKISINVTRGILRVSGNKVQIFANI